MKLGGDALARFAAKPDGAAAGILLHGGEPTRIALRRQEIAAALLGPDGATEMRLDRLAAADLKGDPAALSDALKARGFFAGQRVVHLAEATEAQADAVAAALADWRQGDAFLIVTAGGLAAKSRLRKLFEGHDRAYSAGLYADPISQREAQALIAASGLHDVPDPAMADLLALSDTLEPGDFRQLLEKLALYKLGDESPLSPADVAAMAPLTQQAATDTLIDAVCEGRSREVSGLMRRLQGQGVQPVFICLSAGRHFRGLAAAAGHAGGPAAGLAKLRPPLWGRRRDTGLALIRRWGPEELDWALSQLLDTDLALRSTAPPPAMAQVERVLIQIAQRAAR